MTLVTAIIGGLACGYFLGFGRRSFATLLPLWTAVAVVQTLFLVPTERVDAGYWPFQGIILALAVLMVWLGATVRARLSRAA